MSNLSLLFFVSKETNAALGSSVDNPVSKDTGDSESPIISVIWLQSPFFARSTGK
jgi:hypothetical protein